MSTQQKIEYFYKLILTLFVGLILFLAKGMYNDVQDMKLDIATIKTTIHIQGKVIQ